MASSGLDDLLHSWAAWTYTACSGSLGGGSVMARWMDCKGELRFDGSGGSRGPGDELEQQVEAAVVSLAAKDLPAADALRLEYAAGWWSVLERAGADWLGYNPGDSTQLDRARLLGCGWRTYKRRLSKARKHVTQTLIGNR